MKPLSFACICQINIKLKRAYKLDCSADLYRFRVGKIGRQSCCQQPWANKVISFTKITAKKWD